MTISLQRDIDAIVQAIPAEYLLDPPDGGEVGLAEGVQRMAAEITRLRAEVERLRAALKWYASSEAWTLPQLEGSNGDYGKRARAALEDKT